jgi:hypothetical protein
MIRAADEAASTMRRGQKNPDEGKREATNSAAGPSAGTLPAHAYI